MSTSIHGQRIGACTLLKHKQKARKNNDNNHRIGQWPHWRHERDITPGWKQSLQSSIKSCVCNMHLLLKNLFLGRVGGGFGERLTAVV